MHPSGRGPSYDVSGPTKALSCHRRLQVPTAQEPHFSWFSGLLSCLRFFCSYVLEGSPPRRKNGRCLPNLGPLPSSLGCLPQSPALTQGKGTRKADREATDVQRHTFQKKQLNTFWVKAELGQRLQKNRFVFIKGMPPNNLSCQKPGCQAVWMSRRAEISDTFLGSGLKIPGPRQELIMINFYWSLVK